MQDFYHFPQKFIFARVQRPISFRLHGTPLVFTVQKRTLGRLSGNHRRRIKFVYRVPNVFPLNQRKKSKKLTLVSFQDHHWQLSCKLQDNNDDEIVEAGSQNDEDAINKVELYYFDCQSFDPLKM